MSLPLRAAILAVLLVATATAASPVLVEGEVAFEADARVRGLVRAAASEGVLDLTQAARNGASLALSWGGASGYEVTWSTDETPTPTGARIQRGDPTTNRSIAWSQGSLGKLVCEDRCRVLLFADPGGTGLLALEGQADGPLATAEAARRHASFLNASASADNFVYEVAAGWMQVGEAPDALPLSAASATGSGRLGLFFVNATLTTAAGETLDTRWRERETAPGPVAIPGTRTVERPHVVLVLEDASFAAPDEAATLLAAPRLALSLEGALDTLQATGALDVDGERHDLTGGSLVLEGDLDLAVAREAAGLPTAPAPRLVASVAGQATRVAIGGADVGPGAPAPAVLAAVGGTVALLAALAFAFSRGALAAFTRIEPSAVLENENRKRLYDAIQLAPGEHVGALATRAGLAQVVVRHHLRVLERHGLILSRTVGKARVSFPLVAVDRATLPAVLLLRDATRRKLAAALAEATGGATQQDLMATTGLSQRLVSYHLSKLHAAGLALVEEGKPRVWRAAPTLVEHLAPASAEGEAAA